MAVILIFISYNASVGAAKYIHMFETCVDSAVGMGNMILYVLSIPTGFIFEYLGEYHGPYILFWWSAIWTTLLFLYVTCCWQNTTYKSIKTTDEDGTISY